jgi:hypothetical protein
MDEKQTDKIQTDWTKEDHLWKRIKERAEKEKKSYWAVTRKCQLEYWNDYGLTKEP